MNERIKNSRKNQSLNKVETIQLIFIGLILIVFIVFIIIQQSLPFYEQLETRIIIVDILLALGIFIEISHFLYVRYRSEIRRILQKKQSKN